MVDLRTLDQLILSKAPPGGVQADQPLQAPAEAAQPRGLSALDAAISRKLQQRGAQEQIQPEAPPEQEGLSRFLPEFITGKERTTPELSALKEIGSAPELRSLSGASFKTSLGLLTTGDTEQLKNIFRKNFGESVSFRQDAKGNEIVDLPSGSYALNKPGLSGQDIARGAFDLAAFTPVGRAATIGKAALGSALTQAGIEAAKGSVGGDIEARNIASAGILGGAGQAVEKGLGVAARAIKGTPKSKIAEAAQKLNIPLMTSDVFEPQTFAGRMAQQTGEKIPFIGTGGLREEQQKLREAAIDAYSNKYGDYSYDAIVSSLKTQKDKIKTAAGSVMNNVGGKLDALGEIQLPNTKNAIASATDELGKLGVIKSGSALDDLANLSGALMEAPQTFTSLKENRTLFNEIVKGADKAERSQLNSRSKALLTRVADAMKKDMDEVAKNNLTPDEFSKWKKANRVYADEAVKLTKTRLKNVLDKGDVTPESVQSLLFSQKPSEVDLLYKSLNNEGRKNARSAIIQRAVSNLSKRNAGVTPNSFATELKKLGLQTNTFFKGEEKKQLTGLLKVLNATRRAQDAPVVTPTGQQLLGAGSGIALFSNPIPTISTGVTLGSIARVYESAPVRNALTKIASLPVGSTRFESELRRLNQILTPAIQSLRSELEDR